MFKIQNLLKTHNSQSKLTNLNLIQLQKVQILNLEKMMIAFTAGGAKINILPHQNTLCVYF